MRKHKFITTVTYIFAMIALISIGFSSWSIQGGMIDDVKSDALTGSTVAYEVSIPIEYMGITLDENESAFSFFEYYTIIDGTTRVYDYTKKSIGFRLLIDKQELLEKTNGLQNEGAVFALEMQLTYTPASDNADYFNTNNMLELKNFTFSLENTGVTVPVKAEATAQKTVTSKVYLHSNKGASLYSMVQMDSSSNLIPIIGEFNFELVSLNGIYQFTQPACADSFLKAEFTFSFKITKVL